MFDTVQAEGGVEARLVERFDHNWLYLLPDDAQRLALSHLDNLWKLEAESEEMWIITDKDLPIMFIGIIPYTLIGSSKYIWTFPFAGFKPLHARPVKRLVDANIERFDVCAAQVVFGFSRGERFARFFEFKPQYMNGNMLVFVREGK